MFILPEYLGTRVIEASHSQGLVISLLFRKDCKEFPTPIHGSLSIKGHLSNHALRRSVLITVVASLLHGLLRSAAMSLI